jgi:hypothetical protein
LILPALFGQGVIEKIKGKTRWVSSTDFLAVLTLYFSSLFFFYDHFKQTFLLTERDLGAYFIPARFTWVKSIKQGDFPLWNPYQFSGRPFLANPQHGKASKDFSSNEQVPTCVHPRRKT